jgi:multiple sugar transport system substrate-binding protein
MKNIQKALFLALMGAGLMAPVQAEEVHMIIAAVRSVKLIK